MTTRTKCAGIATLMGFALSIPAMASSVPFGVASAYNVVALGVDGSTALTGTVSTNADIGGRVAAANSFTLGTTIGSSLGSDPYGSQALYGVVSTNGLGSGQSYNINGGGNIYAPGTSGNINFNDGGHRVTTGSSGIDFSTLRTTLDAESTYLGMLTPNGSNLGTNEPGFGNPSFYVLRGTNPTLNVFTIEASVFASANNPLDIVTPPGSTTIINVIGGTPQVNTGIYYNGTQYAGDSTATSDILFNFPGASAVTIDGQFSASLLAPYALLTGNAQMDGTFIAANVGQTGEIHNVEFTGALPTDAVVTPEPSTLVLAGTGLAALAGWKRKRRILQA